MYNEDGDSMELISKDNKRNYFRVTSDYAIRLKKALGNNYNSDLLSRKLHASKEGYIDIEVSEFINILEVLIYHTDLLIDDNYYESISGPYLDSFKEQLNKYRSIRGHVKSATSTTEYGKWILSEKWVKEAVINGKIKTLEQNIEKMLTLNEVISLITKKRDLERAKQSVLDSLSYILDENRISEIEKQYNDLLEQYPTDLKRIEDYLRNLQKIILDDWRVGTTKLEDYKPGDKFRFVGHSTNQEKFDGEFSSRLVSCSLFTEEFTDTYRSGVGFLFEPVNIIGADGEDMYVDNYTDSDDNILVSTSIPPISSIGKVLSKLKHNKEKQKEEGKTGSVYSEVIIEGFNPIGIFCFTLGEKELSFNYQSALKLQQQFPHLPIIEIDLTLYKSLEELETYKKRLVYEVEKRLNPSALTRDKFYYDLYQLFWEEYLELKKKEDLNENKIIDLYEKNQYLIGLRLDVKDLFSDKYSLKEIKFALLNNPLFGLNRMEYGAFTAHDLECLYNELIDYIHDPRIEQAVPGMRELIKLLSKTNLNEEQLLALRSQIPVTIAKINEMLQFNLSNKLTEIKSDIDILMERRVSLTSSLTEKEKMLDEQTKYRRIIDQESFYTLVNYDYRDTKGKLDIAQLEQARLEEEYEAERQNASKVQESQKLLSQHRIKNFMKLRHLSVELSAFNFKMSKILTMKGVYDETVSSIKQELEFIFNSFKEHTGIEFLEYPEVLAKAHENYSCLDEVSLPYEISELREQIEKINQQLETLLKESQAIEELQNTKTI